MSDEGQTGTAQTGELISIRKAAWLMRYVKYGHRILTRLASEGRIPFARKYGHRWVLTAESVAFLKEHYSAAARRHNHYKHGPVEAMQRAAAKLDPQCAERQKEFTNRTP
jgi:hypothetical protein